MNIILINHYAGSPRMGMEFRPYYMAIEWQEMGHNVSILGASFSHLRQRQPKKTGWQNIENVNYLWLWTNHYLGNGIKRFFSMLIFVLQIFIRIPILAVKLKPDVIIASSTYPLDIFPAYCLAKLSKAKLIFEIHDLWPLTLIELSWMNKWHPFVLMMRFGEWFAYKFSNKIVSILPHTFKHVAQDGVKKEAFLHIPNGINLNDIKELAPMPNDLQTLIKIHKKTKRLLIGYAGSLGIANDMKNLVEAAKLLVDIPVHFVIVGSGTELEHLKSCNLPNITFYRKIDKNMVHNFLKEMDILYLGGKKSSLYKYGISMNKLYDYMLSGKPVIQAIDAANDIITEVNCGFTISPENPAALVKIIKKIIKMPKATLIKLGNNAKHNVITNHNYKFLAAKFLDFIAK